MAFVKCSLVALALLALQHQTLAQVHASRGSSSNSLFDGESNIDLSAGDNSASFSADGYLPPINGSPSDQIPAFSGPPKKPGDNSGHIDPPTNVQPNVAFPPPAQPQIGCAAALLCVEEQFCTAVGVISKTPIQLTEEQKLRRVPMVDCRNPDNGVFGKCCRDPDYVDPWPAGNLTPEQLKQGFDEQGFPKFLNLTKTKPQRPSRPIALPQQPFRPVAPVQTGFESNKIVPNNKPFQPQPTFGQVQLPGFQQKPIETKNPFFQSQNPIESAEFSQQAKQPEIILIPEQPHAILPERPQAFAPERPNPFLPERPQVIAPQQPATFVPQRPSGFVKQPQKPNFTVTVTEQPQVFHQPEQPSFVQTERPTFVQPKQPVFVQTERPSFVRPEQPSFTQTERPSLAQPEQPSFVQPEQPSFTQTERPSFVQPEQPSFVQPEQPSFIQTERPSFVRPEQPSFVQTERPSFVRPEQPSFIRPEQPSFVQPQQPSFVQTERPVFQTVQPQQPQHPGYNQINGQPKGPIESIQQGFQNLQQSFQEQINNLNPFGNKPTDGQVIISQDVQEETTTKKPFFTLPNFFNPKNVENQAPVLPTVSIAPHTPGAQCGIINQVQQNYAGGFNDVETPFGEIPWQAMVLHNAEKKLLCSGAVIAPNVVMTAAHCVYGMRPSEVSVKVGEWKLGYELKHEEPLPFEIAQVQNIETHPGYQPGGPGSDLAMLFLEKPVKLDQHIDTICLSQQPSALERKCISVGWGKTVLQLHAAGALMNKIDVDALSQDECRTRLQGAETLIDLDESLVCVKAHKQNNNLCQVDVGGPLACDRGDGRYELVGVYSQDTGCLPTNQVATFALIDNKWVNEMLNSPTSTVPYQPEASNNYEGPQPVQDRFHYHPQQPGVPCDCQQGTQPAGANAYLPPY